jgi:hypothetical protein
MPITHIHDPITSMDKPASRLRFRTWPNPGSWFPPTIGQFAGSAIAD